MKHTGKFRLNRNKHIPLSLIAFGSAMLLWPLNAFAQSETLTAPQDVTLDVLACSQTASSSATLSWDKQPGATEYRVYTRLGEDTFGPYDSTDSAKIKIYLSSKAVSIVSVSSVEKIQDTAKTIVRESEKSPEFEINVPQLCEKAVPSVSLSPTITKSETTPTETIQTPTQKPEETVVVSSTSATESISPTTAPNRSIERLDKKYTETRKIQAQISEQVHNVINWVKSKLFFLN